MISVINSIVGFVESRYPLLVASRVYIYTLDTYSNNGEWTTEVKFSGRGNCCGNGITSYNDFQRNEDV